MDKNRRQYRQAQEDAQRLLQHGSRGYLDDIPLGALRADGATACYFPAGTPMAIQGYRMANDAEQTEQNLKEGMKSWLGYLHQSGRSGIYQVQKQNGKAAVFLAEGENTVSPFVSMTLQNSVPELASANMPRAFDAIYPCHGLLTGTFRMRPGAWDLLLDEMQMDFFVSVLLLPIPDMEVQDKVQKMQEWIYYLKPYMTFTRTYGNASRRVEEIATPYITEAIEYLKAQKDQYMVRGGRGYFYTAIRYGARDQGSLWQLERLLKGMMLRETERAAAMLEEPVRSFSLCQLEEDAKNAHKVPYYTYGQGNGMHLLSWNHIEDMATCCMLPLRSHPGFVVKNYHVDENAFRPFDIGIQKLREDTEAVLYLGKDLEQGGDLYLPVESLYSHGFISGATNTGKSTTTKGLIRGLHEQNIPVLVIEAAKKEYCHMIHEIPDLRVLTPGNDGLALFINPLEPETGTLIETHVRGVVRALSASLGQEKPIPEAFEALLKMTYEKAGWSYGQMAYANPARPFPVFRDVYDNIDEYIKNHAVYGKEVRQNLTGALTLRTENMYDGALGYLFSNARGYTAEALLAQPTVIELADLEEDTAAFLMNILLFKLHCYLKRLPDCGTLQRVIVVEEAHNVFAKTLLEDSGRAQNNRYFEKMLAEVRASGTGLLLADQRPSIMDDAVLANTAVKIVHGLSEAADRQAIADSIDLTEFQQKKLQELGRGECILAIRGQYGIAHAQIAPPASIVQEKENPACLVCRCRFRCRKNSVQQMLSGMEEYKRNYYMEKIRQVMFDAPRLRNVIGQMMTDLQIVASKDTRLCCLGMMISQMEQISYPDARVIINSYAKEE